MMWQVITYWFAIFVIVLGICIVSREQLKKKNAQEAAAKEAAELANIEDGCPLDASEVDKDKERYEEMFQVQAEDPRCDWPKQASTHDTSPSNKKPWGCSGSVE